MDRTHFQEDSAHPPVIVVGGGLAGLSTACALADVGLSVTLFEKRPYLGGKVFSFNSPFGAMDNGQHIFMKCCTEYIAFLSKLGVLGRVDIQRRLRVPVFLRGEAAYLTRTGLSAPLHLAWALAGYKHLSLLERVAIAKASLAVRSVGPSERAWLDEITFYAWLKEHGQSDRAIARFWDLIVLPALNADCRTASAGQAIMMFQEGFLSRVDAADIGVATVDLSSLLYEEAIRYIQDHGGRVLLGENIAGLEGSSGGIRKARTHGGRAYTGDCFVLALPPRQMLAALPPGWTEHPFFAPAMKLNGAAIINLHLWFDRPVTTLPMAAYLESRIQWVFAKKPENGMQHVVLSISGADGLLGMSKQKLCALLFDDLSLQIPAVKEAEVLDQTLVIEDAATFRPEPGAALWRRPVHTPIRNLFLAGAWTDTGWPATMESAVRSGNACAAAVTEAMRATKTRAS